MNQHYLPKFYLKGFTCKNSNSPYFFQFLLKNKEWKKSYPKGTATEVDFYSFVDKNGVNNMEAENCLSKLEKNASQTLRSSIFQKKIPSEEQLIILSFFMAIMWTRTPHFRLLYNKTIDNLIKEFLLQDANLPKEDFDKLKADAIAKFGDEYQGITQDQLRSTGDYYCEPIKPLQIAVIFHACNEIAYIIANMKWQILVAQHPFFFITSDQPLCTYDPVEKFPIGDHSNLFGYGIGSDSVEITFPFSSEFALHAIKGNPEIIFSKANSREIEQINARTFAFAQNFVISSDKKFPVSK